MAVAPELWYTDIIEAMLNHRMTFEEAWAWVGQDPQVATPTFVAGHVRRKEWRDLWARLERAFYAEKGSAPANTKELLVGKMSEDAKRLRELGKFKEAADIELNKAKVMGLVGETGTTNVFADLTGEGRRKLREIIAAKKAAQDVRVQ